MPDCTIRRCTTIAMVSILSACATTHTPYSRPPLTVQPGWTARIDGADVPLAGDWWRAFDDPRLDSLVERVLARNPSLIAAAFRIRRAGLQTGLAANGMAPQFTGGLSGSTSAGGSRGSSTATGRSGGSTTGTETGVSSTSYGSNIGVAYEVDLFNRLGSLRDAAAWEAVATRDDRDAARLSVVGTTVSTYFQRIQLRDQLTLTAASVAYARRTRDLVETQYRLGAVSGLERAEALRQLAVQEAGQTQLVQQLAEADNALVAILDGERPAATVGGLEQVRVPAVDAGLPARLLARRPDLRAVESRLRAALSNVDATTASFYPGVSLAAGANGSGATAGSILSNPIGTLIGSITLPFLNVERARLSRDISRATFDEGAATFRQTFVQAVRDVDNALSLRNQLIAQEDRLKVARDAARTAERLSEIRYRNGSIALRDWLAAQELRRQAESALLTSRLARLTNHVQLLQALGGDQRRTEPAGVVAGTRPPGSSESRSDP